MTGPKSLSCLNIVSRSVELQSRVAQMLEKNKLNVSHLETELINGLSQSISWLENKSKPYDIYYLPRWMS